MTHLKDFQQYSKILIVFSLIRKNGIFSSLKMHKNHVNVCDEWHEKLPTINWNFFLPLYWWHFYQDRSRKCQNIKNKAPPGKMNFFFIVKIKSMRNLEFVLRLECPNWRRHEWNKLADATSEIVLVHRALWTRTAGQQEEYSWRLIRNYETDEDLSCTEWTTNLWTIIK